MGVLVRRIARQETALANLRRRLEARLSRLNKRREQLRSDLRSIETEIELVGSGVGISPIGTTMPDEEAPSPRRRRRKRKSRKTPSLASELVGLVRGANGKPLTLKAITEELIRRDFPTSSKNFPKMVENRAYDLARKKVLRSLPDRAGFVLGKAAAKVGASRASSARRSVARRGGRTQVNSPTLRELVLSILKKEPRPLPVRDLAGKVLASGFKTQSSDFNNVVRVFLSKMKDEVQQAPEGGYRLKAS
jgi:hypothetical protein